MPPTVAAGSGTSTGDGCVGVVGATAVGGSSRPVMMP